MKKPAMLPAMKISTAREPISTVLAPLRVSRRWVVMGMSPESRKTKGKPEIWSGEGGANGTPAALRNPAILPARGVGPVGFASRDYPRFALELVP